MPWKASNTMEERIKFIGRVLDGEKISALCEEFGISRKTGYKIYDRYKSCGIEGLTDRSRRPYRQCQGLPELDYPYADRTILVTTCGRICLGRKKVNFSTVFSGQKVGITQTADKIWLVSFMHYDLGYFDLDACRVEPIENPFGPKLSPMCQV
ncbi:MAG: helix-turn-helix domain-containing protein [Bdellovibrionales bacterium]